MCKWGFGGSNPLKLHFPSPFDSLYGDFNKILAKVTNNIFVARHISRGSLSNISSPINKTAHHLDETNGEWRVEILDLSVYRDKNRQSKTTPHVSPVQSDRPAEPNSGSGRRLAGDFSDITMTSLAGITLVNRCDGPCGWGVSFTIPRLSIFGSSSSHGHGCLCLSNGDRVVPRAYWRPIFYFSSLLSAS